MMKKILGLIAGLLLLGAAISSAKAQSYSFDYVATTGGAYEAHGVFNIGASLTGGWFSITSITGSVTTPGSPPDLTITGMLPGSILPPSTILSTSGAWIYDNALSLSGSPDISATGGPAFTTAGREWNIWNNNNGTYSMWGSPVPFASVYDVQTTGTLTVTAVPEPEIYAMLAAGLGLMGFVARRRRAQLAAA